MLKLNFNYNLLKLTINENDSNDNKKRVYITRALLIVAVFIVISVFINFFILAVSVFSVFNLFMAFNMKKILVLFKQQELKYLPKIYFFSMSLLVNIVFSFSLAVAYLTDNLNEMQWLMPSIYVPCVIVLWLSFAINTLKK